MRAEVELGQAPAPALLERPRTPTRGPAPRLDRFDVAVLVAFAAVSIWVLALDLWQVVAHGLVWTGTDGLYLVDQMQYVAWVREASHHVLASNLFVLRSTPADYLQPAVVISGGLSALGLPPWLALLLWKPVAVGSAFFAVREYTRRVVTGVWQRRTALVLALFFGSFTVVYGSFGVVGDLFMGFLSWGYTFGLLAVAAMVAAMLAYDRGRSRRRLGWAAPALGALASLLHPWQGELLILVVLGGELVMWRRGRDRPRPGLKLAAVTVAATAAPLAYYAILGKLDLSWQLAQVSSKHSFSLGTFLLAIAPLALPAALGYRGRCTTFLDAATRTWPIASLAVFVLSATALSATPLHAFEGVTIPLAVLAVRGLQGVQLAGLPYRRALAVGAVALATIPATAYELASARTLVTPSAGNANFVSSDERHALRHLASDPTRGGVITRFYLGAVVPAETGRRTFVGNCMWSEPHCTPRSWLVQHLFDGSLAPEATRAIVQLSGARFVLSDCQVGRDMTPVLAPITVSVRRFGCASVYKIDAPGRPVGPLAESGGHAALRAPGRQQRQG